MAVRYSTRYTSSAPFEAGTGSARRRSSVSTGSERGTWCGGTNGDPLGVGGLPDRHDRRCRPRRLVGPTLPLLTLLLAPVFMIIFGFESGVVGGWFGWADHIISRRYQQGLEHDREKMVELRAKK